MATARNEFQGKTGISFQLLMEHLYEFYFKRRKQQCFIYALAFIVSFAYAVSSHFLFSRPDVSAVYDAVILASVIVLSLPFAYILGFIRGSQAAPQKVSQTVPEEAAVNATLGLQPEAHLPD